MKLISIITPRYSHLGNAHFILGIYDADDERLPAADDPRARYRCVDILGSYPSKAEATQAAARYLEKQP